MRPEAPGVPAHEHLDVDPGADRSALDHRPPDHPAHPPASLSTEGGVEHEARPPEGAVVDQAGDSSQVVSHSLMPLDQRCEMLSMK